MKKTVKKIMALLISSIFILNTVGPAEVYAADAATEWNYSYTGKEQVFEAPYSGAYQFSLSGAQGGGDNGGKGGSVTVMLNLTKGAQVSIYVGGQDGYNGGGKGYAANGGTNGGGATDIRINGERIAIAGGGGGGMSECPGGEGGAGGNNGTPFQGSDGSPRAATGGGGGYRGGTAGYINEHVHSGDCYRTCGSTSWTHTDDGKTEMGEIYWEWRCNSCGAIAQTGVDGSYSGPCTNQILECGITEGVRTAVKAKGGSNWYDPAVCSSGTDSAGTRQGNGECRISVQEIYNLFYLNIPCKKVYYNGTKVKKVYYNGILVYKE